MTKGKHLLSGERESWLADFVSDTDTAGTTYHLQFFRSNAEGDAQ